MVSATERRTFQRVRFPDIRRSLACEFWPDVGPFFRSGSFPVLVVASQPIAGVVPTLRRAIEPLIHAPQDIQAARVSRVRVMNFSVLERERTHPGGFAGVRGPIRACGPGDLSEDFR